MTNRYHVLGGRFDVDLPSTASVLVSGTISNQQASHISIAAVKRDHDRRVNGGHAH